MKQGREFLNDEDSAESARCPKCLDVRLIGHIHLPSGICHSCYKPKFNIDNFEIETLQEFKNAYLLRRQRRIENNSNNNDTNCDN